MARVSSQDFDKYATGGGEFFSLKDDKDVAKVRFCYETIDDIDTFSVHEIEVDGKKRYVDCVRQAHEPASACPLCNAGIKVVLKIFVPLYVEDQDAVQIWDRGRSFHKKLESLCGRYKPLCASTFEIERNGKKGDTKTSYEVFPIEVNDGTLLEHLPEVPDPLGTIILEKSYDELVHYLERGSFPNTDGASTQQAVSRRSAPQERNVESAPASRGGRGTQDNPPTRRSRASQQF